MLDQPQVLRAKVYHARLCPRRNAFAYRLYYLALDVDQLDQADAALAGRGLAVERWGLHSIRRRDHGARDGSSLRAWAEAALARAGLDQRPERLILVTLPRVLGFVFNPVSFWYCFDDTGQVFAVISEVNNTFGQTHAYVCPTPNGLDGGARSGARASQDKDFLVSPFFRPKGRYSFGFALNPARLTVTIDLFDEQGQHALTTGLAGRFEPMSRRALTAAFLSHPLVTLKVVALIHWQAIKLLAKGLRFLGGPSAYAARSTPKQTERMSAHDAQT